MREILLDSLSDSVKLLPFLFLTYLLMEFLEHHAGSAATRHLEAAGKFGPVWGGLLGVIPQCGFSAAAASLFAGRVISVGTLLAVFLSTSDEMLPIMISNAVPVATMVKVLGIKAAAGILSGFLADYLSGRFWKRQKGGPDVGRICAEEHCHCEEGILRSAFFHTVKIFLFIFLISLCLNTIIELIGEDAMAGLFTGIPVIGELLAALVGLIPNCASSVILTQLYFDGMINAGAMMAGLFVNAGVGLLVLFRVNRNRKENLGITGVLYCLGVFWGIVIELAAIRF